MVAHLARKTAIILISSSPSAPTAGIPVATNTATPAAAPVPAAAARQVLWGSGVVRGKLGIEPTALTAYRERVLRWECDARHLDDGTLTLAAARLVKTQDAGGVLTTHGCRDRLTQS